MPAPSLRLDWGESVVAVSPDGASVTLHTGGRPALGVHLAGAVPLGLSATDVDEAEHTFSLGGMRVFQRHAVAESWRWRWVVANESASPVGVGLELDLAVEAGWSAWCWAAGAAGLVIVSPRSAPGPVLVVQFEQGHLEWGDPGGSGGGLPGLPGTVPAGRFRLTPEGLALAPGQRWVVAATARWVGDVGAASMLLPPWMEPVHLLGGEPWGARLADVGVTVTDPVSTWYDEVEGVVWVLGPPGTHQVGVHGPRGVTLVDVDWAPPIEDALAAVVSRTLAERLGGMGRPRRSACRPPWNAPWCREPPPWTTPWTASTGRVARSCWRSPSGSPGPLGTARRPWWGRPCVPWPRPRWTSATAGW